MISLLDNKLTNILGIAPLLELRKVGYRHIFMLLEIYIHGLKKSSLKCYSNATFHFLLPLYIYHVHDCIEISTIISISLHNELKCFNNTGLMIYIYIYIYITRDSDKLQKKNNP